MRARHHGKDGLGRKGWDAHSARLCASRERMPRKVRPRVPLGLWFALTSSSPMLTQRKGKKRFDLRTGRVGAGADEEMGARGGECRAVARRGDEDRWREQRARVSPREVSPSGTRRARFARFPPPLQNLLSGSTVGGIACMQLCAFPPLSCLRRRGRRSRRRAAEAVLGGAGGRGAALYPSLRLLLGDRARTGALSDQPNRREPACEQWMVWPRRMDGRASSGLDCPEMPFVVVSICLSNGWCGPRRMDGHSAIERCGALRISRETKRGAMEARTSAVHAERMEELKNIAAYQRMSSPTRRTLGSSVPSRSGQPSFTNLVKASSDHVVWCDVFDFLAYHEYGTGACTCPPSR